MGKGRKDPKFKIDSYGRYSKWERSSRELPKILEFTDTIYAEDGNEFGMILQIKEGRGTKLDFCIKHPPFKDAKGNTEPDFVGTYHVKNNNTKFFIGDCIWMPLEDKVGVWSVSVRYEGKLVAEKKFRVLAKPE